MIYLKTPDEPPLCGQYAVKIPETNITRKIRTYGNLPNPEKRFNKDAPGRAAAGRAGTCHVLYFPARAVLPRAAC